MKNRKLRAAILLGSLVFLMNLSFGDAIHAAVKQSHPRIWLTADRLATASGRVSRNTLNWRNLMSWSENHLSDSPSSYLGDAAYGLSTLKALNFALVYQMTGNATYANKALEIAVYIVSNPPRESLTEWFRYYDWYPSRYALPALAMTLDWCWAATTTEQRSTIMAGIDELCASMLADPDKWAWYDPSNNYYLGNMWGLLTGAYVLSGHDPYTSNASRYLAYAKDTMLAQAMKYCRGENIIWSTWDNTTGRAKGGLWNEGTAYGSVDTEFICSSLLAAISAESIDFGNFAFPDEVVLFYIYATYPSGDHTYAEGDGASSGGLGPTTRVPLLFATACATDDVERYGQYWLNTCTTNATSDYKLYNEFLWYADELQASDYRTVLPDNYYIDGTKMMFWRSGWGANDCWMNLKIGLLCTDHAQNGLGNLIIYQRGYLATDKAYETGNSELASDNDHSVLYIPPYEDKKLYWGASVTKHHEVTDDFLYFAGDMTPAYTAQPDYRHNTVQHKDREFFLLKSEKVLAVMDRGTSFDVNIDKIWQVYLHTQATASGSAYRSSNGNADLVIKTAYPSTAQASFDVSGMPRMRVTTSTAAQSKQFLHLFKVTGSGGAFQTAAVTISGATIAAAAFAAAADTVDYLLAFSADPAGNPATATSYTLTFTRFNNEIAGYIMNCTSSTTYYVASATNGDAVTFTISRSQITDGTALTSDAEGLLAFRLNLGGGEPQQPVQPPPGIGIKEGMH